MLSNPNGEMEKMDPRVRRTRQMLVQAFMELVKSEGFQAINVQEITDRAGVNRATFYAHFQDKYALLDYSVREGFQRELESRVLNACEFSIENLRLLIVTVCEFVAELHAHCLAPEQQFQTLIETQIRTQVYGLILHWLEITKQIENNPERAATAASWAIYGLAQQWSKEKHAPPADQFANEVLPLVANNLSLAHQPA